MTAKRPPRPAAKPGPLVNADANSRIDTNNQTDSNDRIDSNNRIELNYQTDSNNRIGSPRVDRTAPLDSDRDRRVRRAQFLTELVEARELRKRVAPRRTRVAEFNARRLRTFRY